MEEEESRTAARERSVKVEIVEFDENEEVRNEVEVNAVNLKRKMLMIRVNLFGEERKEADEAIEGIQPLYSTDEVVERTGSR